MNSRSTGSPVSDSTDGTNVSHSASSVARWVSSNTAAATAISLLGSGPLSDPSPPAPLARIGPRP